MKKEAIPHIEMKSVSNATIAVLCRVLPILIEEVRKNKGRNCRIENATRMATLALRKINKINVKKEK